MYLFSIQFRLQSAKSGVDVVESTAFLTTFLTTFAMIPSFLDTGVDVVELTASILLNISSSDTTTTSIFLDVEGGRKGTLLFPIF